MILRGNAYNPLITGMWQINKGGRNFMFSVYNISEGTSYLE
jgi:hypothetical protein